MRIAILCLEKGGGLSHCAYELAKAMSARADITCFLAEQNDMLDAFAALACEIRAFPLRRGRRSLLSAMITGRESSGIAGAILDDNPDVVLDAGSGAWASVVLRQLGGRVPIAQIVHDVYPHPDLRSFIDALPGIVRPALVDVLIGPSAFSFAELARKFPQRPRIQSKIGVLMPPNVANLASVAERRHRQLFVGRIHPYKGVDVLVEAYAIIRQLHSAVELSIVGRGPISTRLLRRIRALGVNLDNRYLSDAALQQVLASHGVMILPYTSATQSGVAALALAHGIPCVATNVGGLAEQVIHGSNGLIVPAGDPEALAHAMVAIATNESTARHMAEESLRIGRDLYSWSIIGDRLLDDLTAFLAARSRDVAV
jgi:glycosyltransferase involved in cell wall biosynthesis